ncbi:hypothetical protein [Nitrospira sp. Nam74]
MRNRIVSIVLLGGCIVIGSVAAGCTTHTHEREDAHPPTVIHNETAPPSSAVREGAREGAREGVHDATIAR